MSDKQSVQKFLLELICLNDLELMEIYSRGLIPMLQRLEQEQKAPKNGAQVVKPELRQIFVSILERSQEILQ